MTRNSTMFNVVIRKCNKEIEICAEESEIDNFISRLEIFKQ